jgi:hypothetical protein
MYTGNKNIHASFLIYILSMITPIFIGAWTLFGLLGVLLGWMGLLGGDLLIGLPWVSNVLYLISLFVRRLNLKIRIVLSIVAVAFGLLAVGIREIPENEGGGTTEVYVGFGFIIWMASFVYLLVDQIKELKNTKIG